MVIRRGKENEVECDLWNRTPRIVIRDGLRFNYERPKLYQDCNQSNDFAQRFNCAEEDYGLGGKKLSGLCSVQLKACIVA